MLQAPISLYHGWPACVSLTIYPGPSSFKCPLKVSLIVKSACKVFVYNYRVMLVPLSRKGILVINNSNYIKTLQRVK